MLEQAAVAVDPQNLNWAADAPRGGKAVLNRIIKEKATVPLFFGQTLINSLRDVGYNSTTSALCEHVDNAIEWGAQEVRIYIHQTGKRGNYRLDIAVLDNGVGMAPNVLKTATAFGGSMVFGNRTGIGRFGMGMKTAALSMSSVMDLYSWQEPNIIYNMVLDVDAIGAERTNLIELSDPKLVDTLPNDIVNMLTKPVQFPSNFEEQEVIADNIEDLKAKLGKSGTLVYMPECDRLTANTARTLVEHATKEMSRVYRKFLAKGIKLYINNRLVDPFDPTYSIPNARHNRIPELEGKAKNSRLIIAKQVNIKRYPDQWSSEYSNDVEVVPVMLRLYALPIEDWGTLSYKVKKNDLHLFEDHIISVLRNDREVYAGSIPKIVKRHSDTNWFRLQIDFPGELDEAFGVSSNKQGVRPKEYVLEEIRKAIHQEIATVREQIKQYQSEQTVIKQGSKQSIGENKANEAEGFQSKLLLNVAPTTEEEKIQLEANLRTLALMLKRDKETDDEAFQRIKDSKHIIHYKHDNYWPFYRVEYKFGKVILTINTAHPFYTKLYEPLNNAALSVASRSTENLPENGEGNEIAGFNAEDTLVSLQLMLLSLARAQSYISSQDEEREHLLDQFQKEWSDMFKVQLTATTSASG